MEMEESLMLMIEIKQEAFTKDFENNWVFYKFTLLIF